MQKAKKLCATPLCENEHSSRSEYCQNCRSSFYYWSKKRPAHVLSRRTKLSLYQDRLVIIIAEREISE